MLPKSLFLRLVVIVSAILISSCGPINRGMLLWSHDDASLPSGSVVNIFAESELRGSYEIRYRNANGETQNVELESWRVQTARSRDELRELQAEYEAFAPYFGIAEIQALPVRDAMATDASTSIIYRLAKDEKVKILGQSETEVEVGGLRDYWFRVLTADGTQGYVFGYRLDKVDALSVSTEEEESSIDEFLEIVMENVWRPEYFLWMIDDGAYNLSRFRNEYRFYHNNEASRFILRTEKHRIDFDYEELFRARYKEYLAIGSDLHIIVYSDDRISIQYDVDGRAVSEVLVRLSDNADIGQIIAAELERRQAVLENFLSRGNRLNSNRYGNISLREDGSGFWQSYERYDIFPDWFTGSFQLSFPLYVHSSLQEDYQGALSLTEPGQGLHNSINFLYSYINRGLLLELVPHRNIDGNLVLRRSRDPVTIFFRLFTQ